MANLSRPAQRRRKRDTTEHTLELLNGLNQTEAPLRRSARERTTDVTAARTRSDVFGIPPSPDARRSVRTSVQRHSDKSTSSGRSGSVPSEDGAARSNDQAHTDVPDLPSPSRIFALRPRKPNGQLNANNDEGQGQGSSSPESADELLAASTSRNRRPENQKKLQPLVQIEIPVYSSPLSAQYTRDPGDSDGKTPAETRNVNDKQSNAEQDPDFEQDQDTDEEGDDDVEDVQSSQSPTEEYKSDDVFREASRLFVLERSWSTLVKRARQLGELADEEEPRRFETVNGFIAELTNLYTDPANQYSTGHQVPSGVVHNLIQGVSDEALGILNKANRDGKKGVTEVDRTRNKRSAGRLVDDFEIHVLPALALSACMGLRAHYADGKLSAFDDLEHVLKVFLRLCEKISNLNSQGCIASFARTRSLRYPVRKILTALAAEALERKSRPWQPQRDRQHNSPPEVIDLDPDVTGSLALWTDHEGEALLDGLKLYDGPDRYHQIIRHSGQKLRGRTVADLQAKAREIRDNYRPAIEEQLQTEQGLRRWEWLLSV